LVKHGNELDIDLAYRTLVLLGELAENSLLPTKTDVRSLAANLCLYQDHWATPIFNPMLGRKDFDKPLPTPRPITALEHLKSIVPVSAQDIATTQAEGENAPWKGVIDEAEKKYVVVGGKVWKQLVESGKITGDDAKSAEITVFSWLKDLFDVFYALGQVSGGDDKKEDEGKGKDKGKGKGKGKSPAKGKGKGKGKEAEAESTEELEGVDKLKENARNLAACWYYTATEVDFDEEEGDSDGEEEGEEEYDEDGDEDEEGDEDEDEDEEDEDEEEEGEEEEKEEEKKEGKEEKKAETKDEADASTSERSPKRHKPDTPTKEKESKEPEAGGSSTKKEEEDKAASGSSKVTFKDLPASLDDKDEEGDEEDEEDDEEFDPDELNDEDDEYIEEEDFEGDEVESDTTKRIRESIMQGVEALGAYIPNPETDPVFFKRMVVKMRTVGNEAPQEYSQLWFPLGTDPTIFLNVQK